MTETADDLYIGRVISERYRLVRCVGRGGMGAVYEGFHVQTEKRVAVKLLAAHLSKDLKLITRFRREAMAASRLDHENCVQVYDFGEDADGTFFIAMEFVDGVGLGDEIRSGGAMPQARVARLGVQLLSALDVAHASGILHRDLKPQNIMVTKVAGRTDVIKVVDFGIAKFTNNSKEDQAALTVPGTIFGTPEYMSPEQARGEELDGRSDLYSSGVVLWHLLLGRSPFRGKTVRETLIKVFGEHPPSPRAERPREEIDAAFEKALLGGLEKDRDRRYPDAAAFLTALQPYDLAYSSIDPTPQRSPAPGFSADGSAPETLASEDLSSLPLPAQPSRTQIGHIGGSEVESTSGNPLHFDGAYVQEETVDSDAPDLPSGSARRPLAAPPISSKDDGRDQSKKSLLHSEPTVDDDTADDTSDDLGHVSGNNNAASKNASTGAREGGFTSEAGGERANDFSDDDDDDDLRIPGAGPDAKMAAAVLLGLVLLVVFAYGIYLLAQSGDAGKPAVANVVDTTKQAPNDYEPDLAAYEEAMTLAQSAKSEGHTALAAKMYEKAARANLEDGAAHQALVTVYVELGELDRAGAHLVRLDRIHETRYRSFIEFTRRVIDLKRKQAAEKASAR